MTASFFVHPQGLCESTTVGEGTRIWAFAHVLPRAALGRDCNICDHVFIENDVIVGDRVTVKCGVQLWDGLRIEDDVFIGPNATFTNDPFPRSKVKGERAPTTVRKGASVGANATILPGLTIGAHAMIGAGSVVMADVPPNAIVAGNPARIMGYVDSSHVEKVTSGDGASAEDAASSTAAGATLFRMPVFLDLRGSLSVLDCESVLPFKPARTFFVYDVPSQHVRGEHAHKECFQFLVCAKGACSVVTDDGKSRAEWRLDAPSTGLLVPPMVWASQYKYSQDAVLVVFASHAYDAADYIRDYETFRTLVDR
jgi:acetyltransferase-like isoleucine patch superfamily enzyme/dTDP-4-dehydrorhamnose 3,5-epimerase-like enzyme